MAELEAAARNRYNQVTYGRHGTPTTFALEEAVAAVEGGHRAVAFCSGAAACFASILAFVKAGDHVLVTDSVYGPVRDFCTGFLARFGVETTFYDPLIGAGIAALLRPNTALIYLESPGSLTFEVQDVPAIVAVAKARGIDDHARQYLGGAALLQAAGAGRRCRRSSRRRNTSSAIPTR